MLVSLPTFAGELPIPKGADRTIPPGTVVLSSWCVEVHWNPPHKDGTKIGMHYPPLNDKQLGAMKRLNAKGRVTLKRCQSSET